MVGVLDMERRMERQYKFALNSIACGHTILIYRGVTARSSKHVKTAERLALVDGIMYVDNVSCAGMTVALKPEGWK